MSYNCTLLGCCPIFFNVEKKQRCVVKKETMTDKTGKNDRNYSDEATKYFVNKETLPKMFTKRDNITTSLSDKMAEELTNRD